MATSRSTSLAWYSAGTILGAGVAGTDWWPGGPIATDTSTTGTVAQLTTTSTVTGTGYSTSWVGRFVKVGTLETYITAATATVLTVQGLAPTGVQNVTVWGEWFQNKPFTGTMPQYNTWNRTPIYTNIYLKNVQVAGTGSKNYNNITVGISRLSGAQNRSYAIGLSTLAVSTSETAWTSGGAMAGLWRAPAGVTFGNSITVGNLTPGQFRSIWIKDTPLSTNFGTTKTVAEAGFSLSITGTETTNP
jgi:hypothetical protein